MIIRKAKVSDVEQIYELVNYYANKNMMLSRARSMLYENIRDFVVIEINNKIAGVGALHILWNDLAELRTLAVKDSLLGQGIGSKLVKFMLNETKELGIHKVFTLTYQTDFFRKLGFIVVNKETLPQKVWTDCINCSKFPNCNETCLEINIYNK